MILIELRETDYGFEARTKAPCNLEQAVLKGFGSTIPAALKRLGAAFAASKRSRCPGSGAGRKRNKENKT